MKPVSPTAVQSRQFLGPVNQRKSRPFYCQYNRREAIASKLATFLMDSPPNWLKRSVLSDAIAKANKAILVTLLKPDGRIQLASQNFKDQSALKILSQNRAKINEKHR